MKESGPVYFLCPLFFLNKNKGKRVKFVHRWFFLKNVKNVFSFPPFHSTYSTWQVSCLSTLSDIRKFVPWSHIAPVFKGRKINSRKDVCTRSTKYRKEKAFSKRGNEVGTQFSRVQLAPSKKYKKVKLHNQEQKDIRTTNPYLNQDHFIYYRYAHT